MEFKYHTSQEKEQGLLGEVANSSSSAGKDCAWISCVRKQGRKKVNKLEYEKRACDSCYKGSLRTMKSVRNVTVRWANG